MGVLPELAESFEKLSKQESAALGQKLGLDQGTIMLLRRGRREVEDQIRIRRTWRCYCRVKLRSLGNITTPQTTQQSIPAQFSA